MYISVKKNIPLLVTIYPIQNPLENGDVPKLENYMAWQFPQTAAQCGRQINSGRFVAADGLLPRQCLTATFNIVWMGRMNKYFTDRYFNISVCIHVNVCDCTNNKYAHHQKIEPIWQKAPSETFRCNLKERYRPILFDHLLFGFGMRSHSWATCHAYCVRHRHYELHF